MEFMNKSSTEIINAIATQFEEHQLFRRIMLFFILIIVIMCTSASFEYARYAADQGMSGNEIVAVVATIQVPITALLGYAYKLYNTARQDKQ